MSGYLRMGLASIAMVLAAAAGIQTAAAHHSSAVYDTGKTIVVTGTVTKVMWMNPHAYFMVDGKIDNGPVEPWEFLLNSPNQMNRAGSSRNSVKVGDVVEVHAYPGRAKVTRAFARWVILPDKTKTLVTE